MATKEKAKKTAKQKWGIVLKVLIGIICVIAIIAGITAIVNAVCVKSSEKFISSIQKVNYENQLIPEIDDRDGYYTFKTDEDMKVMHLTDVHIGGGFMSTKKDAMSINAVAAMITEEKPDLVIVTGDIAYPVPFQAGTFNNKTGAKLFAKLMEQLGVYWAPVFGNHDTEAYSFYSRKDISKFYSNKEEYPHCLFQAGPADVDGYGNYIIKAVKSTDEITQAFVMLDSHSYVDNDYFGIMWKYDCVHKNQVEWYENQINLLTEENFGYVPSSLMYFHIPPKEMQEAFYTYRDNGFKDTDRVHYKYGVAGETGDVVFSSNYNYGLFESVKKMGSTNGIFFGHDHINTMSFVYDGIQLGYGMSIDYLAYVDIYKVGAQRGCTIFTIHRDSTYDIIQENYYQDKYQGIQDKETVSMENYYDFREAE